MIYLGIDPGLDGALAAILPTGMVITLDTPTLTIVGKTGKRREYNLQEMAAWLKPYANPANGGSKAIVENVHAMPGQGVRSMFTMGYGVGAWEGVLAGLGIAYERVTPQRWKKALMDGMGKDKDAGRFKASQLFPEAAHMFKRKRDDGRAEALLIAEYGRRVLSAHPSPAAGATSA